MLVTAACALVAWAAPACADESAWPTTQATAYNFDFVPYLDPPAHPAAICLVDSGVNVTPDTPPDSPDGPIVKRLSLDGGPGTAANATWEGGHGTRMAMVGAAPMNGWGTVGVWPGVRIVSIRVMPIDQMAFPFADYTRAMDLCNKHADSFRVVVVNLSLGCICQPSTEDRSRLDLQIAAAHNNGQSVVVAAGNEGGAVASPGNAPGAFAVAASDKTGALCSFSNRGDDVDLVAPGCDVDLADPSSGQPWSGYQSGTSGASMTTSVVVAMLRSYRPDLTWQGAEKLVASSAGASAGGPILDVEALFRAAGLGELVDAATARAPASSPPTPAPAPGANSLTSGMTKPPPEDFPRVDEYAGKFPPARLPVPRVKTLLKRGSRVSVAVRNLPRGARLLAVLESRLSEFGYARIRRAASPTAWLSLRVPDSWRGGRMRLSYALSSRPRRSSPAVYRGIPR